MKVEIVKKWNSFLKSFLAERKDIYYTEEYVNLYRDSKNEPMCIVCSEDDHILMMPFLQGHIESFLDYETPYGYGGPISNFDDEWNKDAVREMNSYFEKNGYLCGFVRFHPLLKNSQICKNDFYVIDDRNTIAIDTSLSIDEIWQKEISSKNRNMIRKAEKNGLSFEADYEYQYIDEFEKLYLATMDRLNADEFYMFGHEYYENYIKNLSGKGFLGIVRYNSEIVGAALFMIEKPYGHYHLAGSKRAYSSLGINNFLLWNAAKEMNKNGVMLFHLGGGTDGDPENSLFKFKSAFSRERYQFSIGKRVYNKNAYDKICKNWEDNNPDKSSEYKNFLLKYRY